MTLRAIIKIKKSILANSEWEEKSLNGAVRITPKRVTVGSSYRIKFDKTTGRCLDRDAWRGRGKRLLRVMDDDTVVLETEAAKE